MRHTPFKAIADPTRREIITLLAQAREALPITTITERFHTSRQAVTKHIKILQSAGLIEIRKRGRERYCTVNVLPLQEVHAWVSRYNWAWEIEPGETAIAQLAAARPAAALPEVEKERPQEGSALRSSLYRAVAVM